MQHLLFELTDTLADLAGRPQLGGVFALVLGGLGRAALALGTGGRGAFHDVADILLDTLGHDAMLFVEGQLLVAAALGLVDGALHGAGDAVGVEDGLAVEVARCPADGLDQRALGAQEALLVGVEYRHQGDLGHVQTFAQQVDAHQDVEGTQAQVADDLHPLHGIDVRVQVAHPHVVVGQVVGEVFGHALGQGGAEHPLLLGHPQVDLGKQVVHLGGGRADLDHRIDQAGGPHHLLDHAPGVFFLIGSRGRRDEDGLGRAGFPLLELQWPVVQRRGQAEAVFHQGFLA